MYSYLYSYSNGLPGGALGWVFLAAKLKLYRLYLFERLFCVKNGNGNLKAKLVHV